MANPHRAWAEVDLDAFLGNLAVVRRRARGAEVWPVLKANAYGHGAGPVARTCATAGVRRIGVADGSEALALREAGVTTPLLVLGAVIDSEVPDLLGRDVEVGLHSEARARRLGELARRAGRRLGVHLEVDVGMGRLGVRPEAVPRVVAAVAEEPALELRALMAHFPSSAGWGREETRRQHAAFAAAVREAEAVLGRRVPTHCANSASLFTDMEALGDAVRPGISLFGILPRLGGAESGLRPILSLRTQVVFLKDVPAGTPVGYDGRWTAPRPTRIATLPIGYNDGIPWRLGVSSGAEVLVRGVRCPVVGAISMDYVTVDVGHVPGVGVGDVVTLVGRDGEDEIRVLDLARAAGTIPYELTCRLGARVRRVYKGGAVAVPAAAPA